MKKRSIYITILFSMIFSIGLARIHDTYAGEIKDQWYHSDTRDGVSITMSGNSKIDQGIIAGSFDVSARTMLNCGDTKVKKITNTFRIEGWGLAGSNGVFGKVYEKTFTSSSDTRECLLSIQEGYSGLISAFFKGIQTTVHTDKGSVSFSVPGKVNLTF